MFVSVMVIAVRSVQGSQRIATTSCRSDCYRRSSQRSNRRTFELCARRATCAAFGNLIVILSVCVAIGDVIEADADTAPAEQQRWDSDDQHRDSDQEQSIRPVEIDEILILILSRLRRQCHPNSLAGFGR